MHFVGYKSHKASKNIAGSQFVLCFNLHGIAELIGLCPDSRCRRRSNSSSLVLVVVEVGLCYNYMLELSSSNLVNARASESPQPPRGHFIQRTHWAGVQGPRPGNPQAAAAAATFVIE